MFETSVIPVSEIRNKEILTEKEKIMLSDELSGREPIEDLIVLSKINKDEENYTLVQIKSMLSEMGFRVDPIFSHRFSSDFTAVMNIGEYVIPYWIEFVNLFPEKLRKRLLTKYSMGKERLHVRVYANDDGRWYFTSHTEFNWINPNPAKIYHAHLEKGSGNYKTGTDMMKDLFAKYQDEIKGVPDLPVQVVI